MTFSLVQCSRTGLPADLSLGLPPTILDNAALGAALYARIGYHPPWVGYVAVVDGRGVGGGAFVGPPRDGEVEIAYYTLEDQQHRGFAGQTAAALVTIARASDPSLIVAALTLPAQNPSTRILHRLGFVQTAVVVDDEAGEVWKWTLNPTAQLAMEA